MNGGCGPSLRSPKGAEERWLPGLSWQRCRFTRSPPLYGEQGLRERLTLETAAFSGADRRRREPYVNHLLRVALRIICHYEVLDADLTCAALLHDSMEDHAGQLSPSGARDEAFAVLAGLAGQRAADLVVAVTNPVYAPGADKYRQYLAHVTAGLESRPRARVLKASDFTDYAGLWIMPSRSRLSWSTWVSVRKLSA